MEPTSRLDEIRNALAARDPDLARLVVALAGSDDPQPARPPRDGAFTFQSFRNTVRRNAKRRMEAAERTRVRQEGFAKLLAPDAEVVAPDRLRLDAVLLDLWRADGAFERASLLKIIDETPLSWGVWRGLKQIFKEAQAKGDLEMFGALTARLDTAVGAGGGRGEVRQATLSYMVRRAWRYLRGLGQTLPAAYPDAAVQVLRFYTESCDWKKTWVSNQIFYKETKQYSRRRFRLRPRPSTLLKHRAYAELWRRSPRPLFLLLETARAEQARRYAADALRTDFRTALREVEPTWVARLVSVQSAEVHGFVVWVLKNVPRFEQAAFRELGLHEPVLELLDSPSNEACVYAADYARTHARDLPLERLLRLVDNDVEQVRNLARDLLRERDPRKDVGLEAWGRLLASPHAHDLAAAVLRKHFGARELTPAWFKERLLSDDDEVFAFASDMLVKIHPLTALGVAFFRDLLDDSRLSWQAARFALDKLERLPTGDLDAEFVRRSLVHPHTSDRFCAWIDQDRIKAADVGPDFLRVLAFKGTFDASPWVKELRASGLSWAKELEFNEGVAAKTLRWLGDVRRFSPDQLGFDWLMLLVQRSEPLWHSFAGEYMIKAFLPADFAPKGEESAASAAPAEEVKVDFGGKSFLFTGKMATMQRDLAEAKVTACGGTNASGVNKKLDYLVIGDDGSSLYGSGRKGSKQLKAESLINEGAPIRIISETAFLQMLTGGERTFDTGSVESGCTRLWEMATAPGAADAPLARFALHYLRRHHMDISLAETDRPVDPGAEIPSDFLSFERVKPLFADPRKPLRDFALELARWELKRWDPAMDELVALCELPHAEVRDFVVKALLADSSREHDRYRIPPARLTADAVYRFCESPDAATREVGMELIRRNPRLAIPEELFRLTESPDRSVRGFVIRSMRALYSDKGTTEGWKPRPPPASALTKAAPPPEMPPGRPENPPAPTPALLAFLRRVLFGIAPARPPAQPGGARRIKPLPHRKAKLAMIETLRDLAVEDAAFAHEILPLLREFSLSRGPSEHAACLVAVARIQNAHSGEVR